MVGVRQERHLQAQQGILAEIDVHRVDRRGFIQEIIQDVTTRAGDGHHPAFGRQVKELPVDQGVFPTGVINQAAAMEVGEEFMLQLG